MAALVVLIYLAIDERGLFPRGSTGRYAMFQSHFWLGLSALVLVFWRLAVRRRHGVPAITPPLPIWQARLATAMHVALYAFFIVMPVLGLATAWTDGKMLYVPFTQIMVPPLLGENKALEHTLETIHVLIGQTFYWVIGLHVAVALYHHFIRRDDALRRLL
jgi:cytochrome b561